MGNTVYIFNRMHDSYFYYIDYVWGDIYMLLFNIGKTLIMGFWIWSKTHTAFLFFSDCISVWARSIAG